MITYKIFLSTVIWQHPQNKPMGLHFPKGIFVGLIFWGGGYNKVQKNRTLIFCKLSFSSKIKTPQLVAFLYYT